MNRLVVGLFFIYKMVSTAFVLSSNRTWNAFNEAPR